MDRARLSGLSAVSYDSALYAFQLAADGYARFKFGDNTVLNTLQAESNTPYVVNQDGGDFATIPDFLDSQHKIETAADADAYLARLRALAVGLDAETERVRRDAGLGVDPARLPARHHPRPDDRLPGQAAGGWGLVDLAGAARQGGGDRRRLRGARPPGSPRRRSDRRSTARSPR